MNPAITSNIITMKIVIIASLIRYWDSFICSLIVVFLLIIPLITFSSVLNNIIAPANANILEGISNIPWGKIPYKITSNGHERNILKKLYALSAEINNEGIKKNNPPIKHVKSWIILWTVKAINVFTEKSGLTPGIDEFTSFFAKSADLTFKFVITLNPPSDTNNPPNNTKSIIAIKNIFLFLAKYPLR